MRKCVLSLTLAVVCAVAAEIAQAQTSASFDSAGVSIRYEVRGAGTPVVLIHGFTGSAQRHFGTPGIIDALSKEGYRVVAMDCRGHGQSAKPLDSEAYGLQMVDDVVRLLDHLRIDRAHIVGYSMGGAIALQMLVRHPQRLLTATMLGAGWEGDEARETKSMLLSLADGFDKKDATALIRGVQAGGGTLTEEQIAAANADLFTRNPPQVLAAIARGLLPLYDVQADRLRAVSIPLLALMGEYDNTPAAKRLVSIVPGAEYEELPKATHASSVRASATPLTTFLARHSRR